MSSIRAGYVGSISFSLGIIRLVLGLIFITIVTRLLTPEEFGTWTLIGGLLVYVLILHFIETYWLTRETARNIESGKTAIFTGGIFSTIGIIAYLLIVILVFDNSEIDTNVLLFGIILVPANFFYSILSAINYGWKPQSQSYGLILTDIIKIPTVLLFIYFLDFGVNGVIISSFLGIIGSVFLHLFYARERLKNHLDFSFLKKWFKLSWLTIYPPITGLIFSLDVTIFTIISGSTEGLGYYGAALVIGSLVGYGGLIFSAIYPKLLGSKDTDFLQNSISRLLYILIPLCTIIIIFAKPALYVLNPLYIILYPAAILLALRFFSFTIFDTCNYILRGIDKVDTNESSSFKDYVKSKLFFVPTLQLVQYSIYAISLTIVLLINSSGQHAELIYYWAIISLGTQIPFTVYICIMVRGILPLKIEWLKICKFIVSSLIFIPMLYVFDYFIDYTLGIFSFVPYLLFFMGIGVTSYIVITYVIDSESRLFIKSIINELKKFNKT